MRTVFVLSKTLKASQKTSSAFLMGPIIFFGMEVYLFIYHLAYTRVESRDVRLVKMITL